jgi:WD40 repeat protein
VHFYSLATYEGVFIKEFPSIHIDRISEFLVTKNYKFLISGGEEGMVKIWDTKMLFKPYTSFQQFIGHSNGIKSIIVLEQKSLIVTCSENSGIYFWNFLGDVTFCETEISQELEKFGSPKEMKEMISANLSNKKAVMNVTSIKTSHLEKTYKQEHNSNFGSTLEKKSRITFESGSEGNPQQVMSMLPVQTEENFGVDLTYSQSTSNFLSSDAFQNMNLLNSTGMKKTEELADKLLFWPKYQPTRVEKL